MKNISFFAIIKQAILLTWKNKFLWFFGFLVLMGSVSATFDFNSSGKHTDARNQYVADFFAKHPGYFLLLIVSGIAIFLFMIFLKIMGTAALIKATNDIPVYSQGSIKNILGESKQYLLRLFFLALLLVVSMMMVTILLMLPTVYLFLTNATFFAFLSMLLGIAIFLPILALTYFLKNYAQMYIVLGNMKLIKSLEAAYAILEKRIKESIMMALISFVSFFVVFAGILLLSLLLMLCLAPFALLGFYFFAQTGAVVIAAAGMVVLAAVLVVVFSVLIVFLQALWVLFFKEIALTKYDTEKNKEEILLDAEMPTPEAV